MRYRAGVEGQKWEWIAFNNWLYNNDHISLGQYGSRKVFFEQVTWRVNDFFSDQLELSDLGYNKVKITQLKNIYCGDYSLLEESRQVLLKELNKGVGHISVSFSLMPGGKGAIMGGRLKSYCMNTIILTTCKYYTRMSIYYRTTEATKKFGGDLIFLSELIPTLIPAEIIEKVEYVDFIFNTIYVSSIFFPIMYVYGVREARPDNFSRICWRNIERADDLGVVAKYSQTKRSYDFYRGWKYGETK